MVNVGSVDRTFRFIIGAVLILAPLFMPAVFGAWGAWRFVAVAVGVVLVATALFRICPAYLLFGIRTCARPGA